MASFSLEDYCAQFVPLTEEGKFEPWSHLHTTSQEFLAKLNLPPIHPFCTEDEKYRPFPPDGVAPMGALIGNDHHSSLLDEMITSATQTIPALYAMGELWIRLFASALAPLFITYFLWGEFSASTSFRKKDVSKSWKTASLSCVLSVASSMVLMTDTYYVLEFGPRYGVTLFLISLIFAFRVSYRYKLHKTAACVTLLLLLSVRLVFGHVNYELQFGGGDVPDTIDEGLYWNSNNSLINTIVDFWPESSRTYNVKTGATPWTSTGDARTGIPFLVNFWKKDPEFIRVFLTTTDDEVVAFDICFPPNGHDYTKPVYMILHGLSGGSQEEYIKDVTHRRSEEGHTIVVMIARGMMDLPVYGWNVFHGARTDDAHNAAIALRRALAPNQLLVGVGYSMGGIILSNYAARAGVECALDAAIAVSGGLDTRHSLHMGRALRLWQPLLVTRLRNTFIIGKFGEKYRERLSKNQMLQLMRAYHVKDVDIQAVVAYNGFDDVHHYYSEMSAMGDRQYEVDGNQSYVGRIANVSIPFCVLHALDDPLMPWRTVVARKGLMHPDNLIQIGSGHLMLLLTKGGGHVGWPTGWLPSEGKWRWMSDAVGGFVTAVSEAKR